MRIVIPENSFSVRLMERQGVTNTMRNVFGYVYTPRFDLDPVAKTLINN